MIAREWRCCPICSNKTRDTLQGKYGIDKLSVVLPEMQAGNIN